MFSSISSYIWGGEEETAAAVPPAAASSSPPRDPSPVPEDWVLVGGQHSTAPGNLGALRPLPPVSPASSNSSESGEEPNHHPPEEVESPLGARQQQPIRASPENRVSLKSLRSAQISKQKNSGKALSSKALARNNMTVICGKKKEQKKFNNMSIKSAGMNKNLKQC